MEGANIYGYFYDRLGVQPRDKTLLELPVFSTCGDDCRQAIEAAVVFLRWVERANPEKKQEVLDTLNYVVEVFWRG